MQKHKQVKGMKMKQWFVRLGTKFIGDLADPGSTKGPSPPWVTKEEFKNAITKMKMGQQAEEADRPGEENKEQESKEGETEEEGAH
jgi:hypothetical protein